jgi:hypothetical protein
MHGIRNFRRAVKTDLHRHGGLGGFLEAAGSKGKVSTAGCLHFAICTYHFSLAAQACGECEVQNEK